MSIEYRAAICPYCSCGCGIYLVVEDGRIIGQEPWKDHPINEGKNCPKGKNAYPFIYAEDRLKTPLVRKNGKLEETSWEEALDLIAAKFAEASPTTFGLLASGKNTNEAAYVLQKFARVVMGTNNVEYCGRLCHSPSAAGLGPTVGAGVMPISQLDLEKADVFFLVGVNLKETFPLMTMRVLRAKARGAKVIVMDPRETATARHLGDIHLQLRPGTDAAVLNGMMRVVLDEGLEDQAFIAARTVGIEDLRQHLAALDLDDMAAISGVPLEKIREAAIAFAKAETGCVLYDQGLNQHTTGADNVKALASLALLVGQYGRPGTGPSPTRGQINGEGTGDMGCLNVFYPGLKRLSEQTVQSFEAAWGVEGLPSESGLPYTVMLQKVDTLYVVGTNPVMAAPDAYSAREALERVGFLVVQDIFLTETAELADVVLPAATWVEREGTHTWVDRRVQKIDQVVAPPGQAKPDWRVVCELAERMGYQDKFDFSCAQDVFEEIRRCVPTYAGITYERLSRTPGGIQWPCPSEDHPGTPTFFVDKFNTPDGLGHFQTVDYRPPAEMPDEEYPYVLTTGRSIFHYHTGTMSRRTPRLDDEVPQGFVQVNPADAAGGGIRTGDIVRLSSRRGSITVPAQVSTDVPPGVLFVPFHFSEASANALTNPALDPACKMPEYKVCAARMEVQR
jgi:formate dehydrogenase major subunit